LAQNSSGDSERLPFKTKLAFGVGSGAESIALFSVGSYAMLYYNQVLGLEAHLAGLAISASLFLDGISDPLVGSISDRTKSRWGRRHIYMFFAPIPIVLSLWAVFNPPDGLGTWALFSWFAVTVVMLRQSMTFYHTPHMALGSELSRDYTERSKVMSYNSFFTWAGAAATTWIALSYFFKATPEYPRGLLNPEPYGAFSVIMGGIALLLLAASAWFTRDRIPYLPKPAENLPKYSPLEFFKDMGKAFANINYVWLLVAYFFLSMMIGLRGGLHLYTNTYYWGLGSEQIRFFVIGSFAGYLSAFLFAAALHGKFDKKATIIVSAIVYALAPSVPILMGFAGMLTPQTPNLLAILIAFSVLSYGAASVLSISIMSALADIADENELKFGLRQEGVLYSTRALFAKVDQAIGAALAGFVLTLISFPVRAQVGEVPAQVIWDLALWDGVLAGIPGFIAVFFYARYKITRASYEETKAALAERRAAGLGPQATAVSAAIDVPEPMIPPTAPRPAE